MTSQRRFCLSLPFSVLLLFLFWAITIAQTADPKPRPSAAVSGRVTIGDKPAPGIIVVISSNNSQTLIAQATSDAEGKYRIGGLPPGQVTIGTFAPTYFVPANTMLMPGAGRVLNLSADETAEGIDFKLTRGGVITGRVTDADGKPVVEERVSLIPVEDNGAPARSGVTRLTNFYMYTTDDRGIYRIYGLQPGHYKVSVGDEAGGASGLRGAGYYSLTYYPGTTDATKAAILEVGEGSEAKNIDINVGVRGRTYTVRGRIIDADTNQPIPGADLSFGPLHQDQSQTFMGGMYSSGAQTNANGEFRLEGVEPGRYAIVAGSNSLMLFGNQRPSVYSDPVQFEITEADVADLEIKAHRGLSVSGTVITDGITDKRALAGISRLLVSGYVQPSGTGIQTVMSAGMSPVAADGSFRLDGLRPGKVYLNISGGSSIDTRGFSVSRIVYERELPNRQLDLVAGQDISGVRIYLVYGTATVKGEIKVEGGTLPGDARMFVALQREGQMESGVGSTTQVDARGRFVMTGVPAGSYTAVLQIISFGQTNLPRGFQRTLRQSVTVTDDSESQITFTIDLTPKEGP
jgi:protocatechuate 3,4-dioxygenase beta subunit